MQTKKFTDYNFTEAHVTEARFNTCARVRAKNRINQYVF